MDYQDLKIELRNNFDELAFYEPHTWSHNTRYLPALLKKADASVGGMALDVFCQRGDAVKQIAPKFSEVIALDLSMNMLEQAKETLSDFDNVTYACDDFLEYDIPENSCGLITMIAALHHMPTIETIEKAKKCLKKNGRLIIIDTYRTESFTDILYSLVSIPVNTIGRSLYEKHTDTPEEMVLWQNHAKLDRYESISSIRSLAQKYLPGAEIRRHLFSRYTLVWVK